MINNNYGRLQGIILLFKLPTAHEIIFSKYVDNFGTRRQKDSPSLFQTTNMRLRLSIVQPNTDFVKPSIQRPFHDTGNVPK